MINTSEGITGKEYSIVVNCYNNYHNEQIIPIISSTENYLSIFKFMDIFTL